MKKIAIISIVLALVASPLFAAGITDSTKPLGHLKASVAVEDNFVFNKDIKTVTDRTKFDLERINQVYAKAAVGLTPYFNVYGKLGGADGGRIDTLNRDNLLPVRVETDYGFMWGIGVSGAKEIMDGWKLGLDAQFNSTKTDADKVTFNGAATTGVKGDIKNHEVQVTPFITKKFPFDQWSISPYVGCVVNYFWTQTDRTLKYSQGGTEYSEGWTLKSEDNVGIVVGTDLEFAERWAMLLEGRFIDETAMTFGASYKF